MTPDEVEELESLAGQAARRVAAQWPGTVEKEDLEQEIIVHLLERPGALDRLFEEPNPRVRQSFLIKVGHQLASQMQADYDRFSGNYRYDAGQVRGFLERQLWLNGDKPSTEKLDLAEALASLADKNSSYYAAVINRFVHEMVPDRANTSQFNTIQRAVEALTDLMNRIGEEREKHYTEGPGSRKAMSNSQARYATEIGPL